MVSYDWLPLGQSCSDWVHVVVFWLLLQLRKSIYDIYCR